MQSPTQSIPLEELMARKTINRTSADGACRGRGRSSPHKRSPPLINNAMPQTNPISIGFGIGEAELKMFYDD
jgi:hypothetical protein